MKTEILTHLPPAHPWGQSLYWYDQTVSTNTTAKQMATEGAPHGTVIVADSQSGGRGRLGRSFCSPAGQGIYMSVILRPGCPPAQLMHLTCAVGVAACDAIEETLGFRPGIKWINDLVAHNKKLGGILTELSISPAGMVDYAVVGIGINLLKQEFPDDVKAIATTVEDECGKVIDVNELTALIVKEFFENLNLVGTHGLAEEYRSRSFLVGKRVNVIKPTVTYEALVKDITDKCELVLELPDGTGEILSTGEVSVREMK